MHPATFNLLIHQGTDYLLTLNLNSGPTFRTAGAKAGTASIPLSEPLPLPLTTGDKVRFDGIIATLSAAADLGANALTVNPLAFAIPRSTGQKCLDLTNHTATAKLYTDLSEAAIATFTADLATAPTEGTIILTLTDTQTAALPASLPTGEYPAEAEVQARKYDGSQLLWQCDLQDGSGIDQRILQGIALIAIGGA